MQHINLEIFVLSFNRVPWHPCCGGFRGGLFRPAGGECGRQWSVAVRSWRAHVSAILRRHAASLRLRSDRLHARPGARRLRSIAVVLEVNCGAGQRALLRLSGGVVPQAEREDQSEREQRTDTTMVAFHLNSPCESRRLRSGHTLQ